MSPTWMVCVLLTLVDVLSKTAATAVRLDDIYWNSSNPIFRIDNTDHIIDVNRNNIPFEYDQVNIICPVYTPGTHEDDAEKYIIYNVSKEEYDTCRITNPNPRIIAVCDKPHKLMYFTITFRSFTPQPGGLEFRPGQDYYFISTSSREDLHRRIGGRCSTHNMKVVFKVCCKPEEGDNKAITTARIPVQQQTTLMLPPAPFETMTTVRAIETTRSTTTTTLRTTTASTTTARTPAWKEVNIQSFSSRPVSKKTDDYDKLSNEVVKNEELSSKSKSPALTRASAAVTLGLSLLFYFVSTLLR